MAINDKAFLDAGLLAQPDATRPALVEAARVEDSVLSISRLVAVCCRQSPPGDNAAELWAGMVALCDAGLKALRELREREASVSLNGLLALRRHCKGLEDLHA